MRKRAIAAALVVVGASLLITAAVVVAAPTELTVRIEGREKTLFEGPILSDGHAVQAASDSGPRRCDGTNNEAHPQPGPTPTAASADAMDLVGQTFGAKWYPGFDDYFIERLGPDEEDLSAGAFWGILVNGVLAPVGGCQWADQAGDEVLWVYDAFSGRRLLWLAAAGDPAVAPQRPLPTAHVEVGQPLGIEVEGYVGGEGESAEVKAAAGVTVGPVATDPLSGFESVDTAAPAAVETAADGSAEITFSIPGWHRIKAQEEAGFIRSNRLDVCVEPIGGGSCGPLPADAALRVPQRYRQAPPDSGPPSGSGSSPSPAAEPRPPAALAILLQALAVDEAKGTASLRMFVPTAGGLVLSGPMVVRQARRVAGAGVVTLAIKPTARARSALRRDGRLRVAVTVSFTPVGGVSVSVERRLTLRLAGRG